MTYNPTGKRITTENLAGQITTTARDWYAICDAYGCRTEMSRSGSRMSETRTDVYGYNMRDELVFSRRDAELGGPASVSAVTEYAYQYDDIGNRITSLGLGTNRAYSANELNQNT